MMPSGTGGGEDTSFSNNEESMEMITEETSLSSSSYHQLYVASSPTRRHHNFMSGTQKKISGVDLSKHSELTPATQSTTESPYSSSSITSAIDDFDAVSCAWAFRGRPGRRSILATLVGCQHRFTAAPRRRHGRRIITS
jgi:hypothetical protein